MKRIRPETFYFNHGENAVILLHSYTGTPNDMRLLARQLEKNNYSVYAPMFAGHGTNNPENILNEGNPNIWWQQTMDAVNFMKHENKKSISIFGLSLGSIFATKAMEEFSDDILCGGVFGSPLFNSDYKNVHEGFINYSKKVREYYNEIVNDDFIQTIRKKSDLALKDIIKATSEVVENLNEIQKPYFIGQGGADELVDPESAKKLNEMMVKNNKDVDFKWYETAGHVLTVNKAHHQLEEDVVQFINNNIK